MHACGHDVHTTCLLGAAIVLNQLKNEFEGLLSLFFNQVKSVYLVVHL